MKKKIKLLLLSSVIDGGAGKAVLKIYRLLKQGNHIDPKILILNYNENDKNIINIDPSDIYLINNTFSKELFLFKVFSNKIVINLLERNRYFQNIDLFNTKIADQINNSDVDVVQLNWITT